MHFFATPDDLLDVLDHVESLAPLHYALMGRQPSPRIERFTTARALPGFGVATSESAVGCKCYLIVPRDGDIHPRMIQSVSGDRDYAIDQLENANSIVLNPGGLWGEDVLLYGRVSTVSGSPVARTLVNRFQAAVRKRCEKIQAYHVSPGAAALLDRGFRLCTAAQSPRSHDLRSPD